MPTAERLRADIDSGRTHDKVPVSDPAIAPLGTDEEAAGTPLTREQVEAARAHEVAGPPRTREDGGAPLYVFVLALIMVVLVGAVVLFLRP
jgi:hypothetical protein